MITITTAIGLLAAVGTTASFFPQVIKSYKTKRTKDISLKMYLILTTGVLLWLVYGIMKKDIPLILANAVTLVLASSILVMKVKNG